MKYSKHDIARRLRSSREALGLSQSDVADRLDSVQQKEDGKATNYNTIGRWENELNKVMPSLKDMLALCEVFDCELGYLLCEHDTKRREAADIRDATGLSEKSVNQLAWLSYTFVDAYEIVNLLITHPYFESLIDTMDRHALDIAQLQLSNPGFSDRELNKKYEASKNEARQAISEALPDNPELASYVQNPVKILESNTYRVHEMAKKILDDITQSRVEFHTDVTFKQDKEAANAKKN